MIFIIKYDIIILEKKRNEVKKKNSKINRGVEKNKRVLEKGVEKRIKKSWKKLKWYKIEFNRKNYFRWNTFW